MESSAEPLAALAEALGTCTELAHKVAQLGRVIQPATALLSEFDQVVRLVNFCVRDMDAETMIEAESRSECDEAARRLVAEQANRTSGSLEEAAFEKERLLDLAGWRKLMRRTSKGERIGISL